ncbi:MAG: hypothetical protein OXC30_03310 [Alphaproteobacteria bacterium]|nr:hypothetical protein [Alphaproteobacteria bacterium]
MPLILLFITCLNVYGATDVHFFDSHEDIKNIIDHAFELIPLMEKFQSISDLRQDRSSHALPARSVRVDALIDFLQQDKKGHALFDSRNISSILSCIQCCFCRPDTSDSYPKPARSVRVDALIDFLQPIKDVLAAACKERDPHFAKLSKKQMLDRRVLIIKCARDGRFTLNAETYLLSFCQLEIDYEEDLDRQTIIPEGRATLEDKSLNSFRLLLQSLYDCLLNPAISAKAAYASCWQQPLVIGVSMAPGVIEFPSWPERLRAAHF